MCLRRGELKRTACDHHKGYFLFLSCKETGSFVKSAVGNLSPVSVINPHCSEWNISFVRLYLFTSFFLNFFTWIGETTIVNSFARSFTAMFVCFVCWLVGKQDLLSVLVNRRGLCLNVSCNDDTGRGCGKPASVLKNRRLLRILRTLLDFAFISEIVKSRRDRDDPLCCLRPSSPALSQQVEAAGTMSILSSFSFM